MPRKWLAHRIGEEYLPFLQSVNPTAAGHKKLTHFTEQLRQEWADRGLQSLQQQQGCMDQLRRSIKDALGEDHFSLDFIGFSTSEYTALNDEKQRSVSERNEAVKFIDNPDAIVAQAVRLLEKEDWADVAAGLAGIVNLTAIIQNQAQSFLNRQVRSILRSSFHASDVLPLFKALA